MIDLQWLIGGEAGYGIMTTGVTMAKIFTRLGLSVFDYVEYPSLIRGGHNAYFVRTSSEVIHSPKKTVDILVALNRESIDKHKDELAEGAAVLYDSNTIKLDPSEFREDILLIPIPLIDMIKELDVERLMINTIAVGASLALFSDDYLILQNMMEETFGRKGDDIAEINIKTSKAGFDFVKKHPKRFHIQIEKREQKSLLISGAESVALGAIKAGLKFAAIYPMTPVNMIMTNLTGHAMEYGIILKEPEDEIAGINMAIGASYAGVRSMVATSGGGFSLMVESLGLAAQAEIPLVIVMGMRPGPATGMPTWSDQGDLRFVLHGAQGDFPRIVLAPGDLREAFSYSMRAFNLADKYQLQVILLVDKHLMEGHGTVPLTEMQADASWFKIERGKITTEKELQEEADYKRYLLTEDGISPRSLPGQKGGIAITGSDEHDERGLYNEEAHVRNAMMEKRFRKLKQAEKDIFLPEIIGDKDAAVTMVSFGSTKLSALDAMSILKRQNISVNLLNLSFLSPFPADKVISLLKHSKNKIIIEANFTGQLEGLIREKTGIEFEHRYRKYDGRPFFPEDIAEKIKEIL
ncbi:2-oxoacid:acceptor oxidoreductase subunit alpha [soil metagenome]